MSTVIRAENLGKKYIIRHQQEGNYQTLREVMSNQVRNIGKHLFCSFKGNAPMKEEFWALKEVSFQVKQGDRVGIIGRNGAGKSTLLKILSRITEPTTGRVLIKGRVASLLEVGTGFHPELTGRENIYLNGAILGMSKNEIKKKFDEIVAFSEVEKFLDTPVKRYSSGMYVRLAFAVAAHLEPEILIVDEVLAVGDTEFQKKCLGKMENVSKEGRTILFVSHNISAIQRFCSRCIYLSEGYKMMDGSTPEVVKTYLSSAQILPQESLLHKIPRENSLGQYARYNKCKILNSNGKPTMSLLFGEPFGVCVEIISESTVEDLSIIIGIDSLTGERIATIISQDADKFFSAFSGRPLCVKAQFTNFTLTPGEYWIHLGLRSGGTGLDELKRFLKFEVSQATFEGFKPHSGTWGYVHIPSVWEELNP
jgi:lipopolysaccharide transport system ATP-binding protein